MIIYHIYLKEYELLSKKHIIKLIYEKPYSI